MYLLFTNIAYAADVSRADQFIANLNKQIVNPLILLLFAAALVYFLIGVVEFIANQSNEEAQSKGKQHMLWGIIGITIMMGVFSILKIIMNTFNIEGINPEQGTVQLKEYTPSVNR